MTPIRIVLVNYFNENELINFVTNHFSDIFKDVSIYVVDNGSKEKEQLKSFCNLASIYYLDPGKNLGYLGAFHYAIEQSGEIENSGFFILCNTDISFDTSRLFAHLR